MKEKNSIILAVQGEITLEKSLIIKSKMSLRGAVKVSVEHKHST